ncbi:MAG TPA: GNAT family N-acetyltransferase [Gammaproteobacteria bacterium]|nr:GNAT family N-acetyltransferase [Gammaproteobacteria bacterium]
MEIHVHDSLDAVDQHAWNALNTDDSPFLSHEFLHALETCGCLGRDHGWYPRYFMLQDETGLIAACPTYIKTNSYGEFVFDWAWAEAYEQHGVSYYPKLISSIPYTPAAGQRLLCHPDHDHTQLAGLLRDAVLKFAEESQLSGVHWLFTDTRDTALLAETGLHLRMDCQYHWQNRGYGCFDDFLADCTAKRRKTLRRERRSVREQGLEISVRSGDSLSPLEWKTVHTLYTATFDRKWSEASLSQDFFLTAGRTLGERMVIVFAHQGGDVVACAVLLRSRDTLYGRYWGCTKKFKDLHFELCFYQGIDYCIAEGLSRFEPGAQGEHKIMRGFVPTPTWSAHRLFHPGFNDAIGQYIHQERQLMEKRCESLHDLLPFKRDHKTSSV